MDQIIKVHVGRTIFDRENLARMKNSYTARKQEPVVNLQSYHDQTLGKIK